MADYWHLWLGALFLRREAFEYQRDRKDSFAHGLLFIVLIGVLAALFTIAGAGMRFASGPNAVAVKNVVLTHVQAMPFYTQMGAAAQQQFLTGFDRFWAGAGTYLLGYPTNAGDLTYLLAGVLTTPLGWIIGWLLYGVLAHLIASRGTPHSSLTHGLGTLALATSPHVLTVVNIFPGASVSGVVIGLWVFSLNVFALRTAYQVSTRRAVWAALFPLLLLLLLSLLLLCIGFSLITITARGVQQ